MQISQQAKLSSCDREAIHAPGMIQPFGAMLAMRFDDLIIVYASENLDRVLGMAANDVLGRHLSDIIGQHPCRRLVAALECAQLHTVSPSVVRFPATGRDCHVHYNHTGTMVIAEFELVQGKAEFQTELSPKGELPFRAIHACHSHQQLCQLLVREMRRLIDFDRAIVYRFDEDWHGVVVAEEKNHRYRESFLHHHFPASDIPAQARQLFTINRLRMIPDVSYAPVRLLSKPGQDEAEPLDMTSCSLRKVAPVHLEYLMNMGVNATLTMSLLSGNRLWGMVNCHNAAPRNIAFGVRQQCHALAEFASLVIERIEHEDLAALQQVRQKELDKTQQMLAGSSNIFEAMSASASHVLTALNADAVQVHLCEQTLDLGMAMPPAVSALIKTALQDELLGQLAYDRNLGSLNPELLAHAAQASGALLCKLNEAGDYFLAFRREMMEARNWAGNPHKHPPDQKHEQDQDQIRLDPRKSFKLWQDVVHGQSERWQASDLDAALELRRLLLERSEQLARMAFEDALRIERERSSAALILANDSLEERVALRTIELERAHEQLRQSQKMDALGQLTGGIAHDFNNLLATIVVSLDIMRIQQQQGRAADLSRYVNIAAAATERAAALTHRLLSFARQQALVAVPVDVNQLISGVEDLVQRALGSSIRIEMLLARELWPTLCDPHQLENALLNLAINARDAMPDGGVLTILTRNVCIGPADAAPGLEPGDYITMSTSDTGCGMAADVVAHAFEPFFTTKPIGEGTGLGLSMIYGFVKQSGGQTRIFSKPGEGATVRLYLPRHRGAVGQATAAAVDITLFKPSRASTVLVVEDEADLRAMLCEMLSELGYDVLDAADAPAALPILRSSKTIDMLVSDIGLPGPLNGRKLAEMARVLRPGLPLLLITGFGDQAQHTLPHATPWLTKPFAIEKFAARVVELLEAGKPYRKLMSLQPIV